MIKTYIIYQNIGTYVSTQYYQEYLGFDQSGF